MCGEKVKRNQIQRRVVCLIAIWKRNHVDSFAVIFPNFNINGCYGSTQGCDEDCILRPCLVWITSPESQANATLFLAKFYGRAGLFNLINAGPHHLRPDIFRSLLHEACGRVINPTYGSLGLIWSGNWEQCQAAVESVLQGSTIMQLTTNNNNHDIASQNPVMPLEGCDIRHLSKDPRNEDHRDKMRKRFKRPRGGETDANRAHSHDSLSVETVEACLLDQVDHVAHCNDGESDQKVKLELTLG